MSDSASYIASVSAFTNSFNFYFGAVIAPASIVLNLFGSYIFLTRKRLNQNNTGFYTAMVCLFDSVALCNSIFFAQLLPSVGINLASYSDFSCRLVSLLRRALLQFPSWVQTLITIDIYFSVSRPYKKFWLFKSRARICVLILAMMVVCALLNVTNLFLNGYTTRVVTSTTKAAATTASNTVNSTANVTSSTWTITNATTALATTTDISTGTWAYNLTTTVPITTTAIIPVAVVVASCASLSQTMSFVADVINVLSRNLVPFVIMLTLNVVIIRTLVRSRAKLRGAVTVSRKRTSHFTLTILAMNMLFIVLYTPWTGAIAMSYAFRFAPWLTSPVKSASASIYTTISVSISYLKYSSNFFLSLAFNRLFRAEVCAFFGLARLNKIQGTLTLTNNNNNTTKLARTIQTRT